MRTSLCSVPGTGDTNEDFAVTSGTVAVVLDGVSQWYTNESGCRHGVLWYVRELGHRLAWYLERDRDAPATAALTHAISDVAAAHGGDCDLSHPWSPAATVAALRQEAGTWEYLVLGDCTLVLERSSGRTLVTDDRLAVLDRDARLPGATETQRRQLREGFAGLRNRPHGYWVASAMPQAGEWALNGTIREADVECALLTDGAAALAQTYGYGWNHLMHTLRATGPGALIAELRHVEQGDPHMRRWPRPKPHDDATAVYCTC